MSTPCTRWNEDWAPLPAGAERLSLAADRQQRWRHGWVLHAPKTLSPAYPAGARSRACDGRFYQWQQRGASLKASEDGLAASSGEGAAAPSFSRRGSSFQTSQHAPAQCPVTRRRPAPAWRHRPARLPWTAPAQAAIAECQRLPVPPRCRHAGVAEEHAAATIAMAAVAAAAAAAACGQALLTGALALPPLRRRCLTCLASLTTLAAARFADFPRELQVAKHSLPNLRLKQPMLRLLDLTSPRIPSPLC